MHPSIDASLGEWLQYIESIHPTEIELGLQRLQTVATQLGLRRSTETVFTVAGTNGKGTTTAVLASLAQASGKRVGWYTSPHLLSFNERIRINNQMVTDTELVHAFYRIEQARGSVSLSYFEYTTLAAFYVFQQQKLDVWVLEVGLGGRLDAVNIIEPDVCVVTNIGLDHQGFLGNTKAEIAREKAGIARAYKPIVLGSDDIPATLYEVCAEKGATVYQYGSNGSHRAQGRELTWQNGAVENLNPSLPNANVATALQAFSLSGLPLDVSALQQVLQDTHIAGRLQRINHGNQVIILDVGHNPHAASYICEQLAEQRYHVLLGMLADKDALGFTAALEPMIKSLSFVDLSVPRGLSSLQLAQRVGKTGSQQYHTVGEFIEFHQQAHPGEPLFIGGSFYTVCNALKYLEKGVGS